MEQNDITKKIKHMMKLIKKSWAEYEPLFSNSTYDPTQRLRGNPITLNLIFYNIVKIYIITDLKNIL